MRLKVLRGLPPEQLQPRASTVGACLRVGQKEPMKGYPIDRHMFFVVEPETRETDPRVTKGRKFEYRQKDRRFDGFHLLQPTQRATFYGFLAQHYEEEIWTHGEMCHRGPSGHPDVKNPSHRGPWCHGNAVEAERWDGAEYRTIPCPGPACPFQQKFTDKKGNTFTPCGPKAKIYFYPRWPDFLGEWAADAEKPLMKFASGGRLMRDTFAGLFAEVKKVAEGLVEIQSWFGLPFSISLGARTNPKERHRYPVIRFALDGDPLAWLRWQGETFKGLLEAPVVLALGAASEVELDSDTVGADDDLTSAGPAVVAVKPATLAAGEGAKAESRGDGPQEWSDGRYVGRFPHREAQWPAERVRPAGPEGEPEAKVSGTAHPRPGIGEDGVAELEEYVKGQRAKAIPGVIPQTIETVAAEASVTTGAEIRPSEWTEDEALEIRKWAKTRAEQTPKVAS